MEVWILRMLILYVSLLCSLTYGGFLSETRTSETETRYGPLQCADAQYVNDQCTGYMKVLDAPTNKLTKQCKKYKKKCEKCKGDISANVEISKRTTTSDKNSNTGLIFKVHKAMGSSCYTKYTKIYPYPAASSKSLSECQSICSNKPECGAIIMSKSSVEGGGTTSCYMIKPNNLFNKDTCTWGSGVYNAYEKKFTVLIFKVYKAMESSCYTKYTKISPYPAATSKSLSECQTICSNKPECGAIVMSKTIVEGGGATSCYMIKPNNLFNEGTCTWGSGNYNAYEKQITVLTFKIHREMGSDCYSKYSKIYPYPAGQGKSLSECQIMCTKEMKCEAIVMAKGSVEGGGTTSCYMIKKNNLFEEGTCAWGNGYYNVYEKEFSVCTSDAVNSGACFCRDDTSGAAEACTVGQVCTSDGTCQDACSSDHPTVPLSNIKGSIITSPGYPQTNYPDNLFCNWTFKTTPGQKVSFTLLDLDTELGYDIIKLYDGAGGDEEKIPILTTMSGTKLHEAVISSKEEMRVSFTTDLSNRRRGFKASIIAFNKEDLPRFDWLDQNIIEVTFPNGKIEIIHLNLSPNADRSCVFQGKTENTSLTISSTNINYGCRSLTQDVEISIISNNLEGKKALFSLKNGKLQKIDETVFISNSLIRGVSQMSKRSTRIKVPKQIHIPVNFGFDRGLLSKLGRYGHGQDFIKRRIEEIFDHGKLLLQGISNSFNIDLILTGDILFIDETLDMNRRDLLKIRQFQVDEKIPLIILIEDDYKNHVKGLSYRSGACRNDTERYGVALVAWNDYSTFIGEVVNHEMGHLLGGIHDGESSDHHSGLHLGHSEFNSQNIQEWFTSAGYRCFGKTCSEAPTSPENGDWSCDNTFYSCQLICTPGFTPVISNIECINGLWNPTSSHICAPSSSSNTVYLLAGGENTETNVEIYHPTLGTPSCRDPPPPLPQNWRYHTTFYHSSSSTLYNCGGSGHWSTCISFTSGTGSWTSHSFPSRVGDSLSSLVIGEKVVFVGGDYYNNVGDLGSEYLTPTYSTLPLTSSPTLTPVPNLSYTGQWLCVAQLSTTSFVITGGHYNGNKLSTVLKYDFADGSNSSLTPLSPPRSSHGCLTIQQEGKLWLIVTGGYNGRYLATTQRLDIQANTWEDLGHLKQARAGHAMVNTERGVLVLAGLDSGNKDLKTVELLVNKEWQKIEPSLSTTRYSFGGAVKVPADLFSCQLNLKPGLGCPALNINTLDKEDETIIEDIATMEDCSLECKKNSNCFFWTWFNQDSGQKRLTCFLMSKYGSTQSDSTAVTADKNCELGCSIPPTKENGAWTCNEAKTTCTLSCSDGFVSPHTRMECSGGEWQDAARINCWRKTQPVSVAGCEDGYLYDEEYSDGEVVTVPEGETCHILCQKRQDCVTWTYTKDQECRLQTSLGASQNKSGSVSGLKNACRPLCYLVVGDDDAATTNTQYCSDRNQLTSCVDIIQLESSQFKDRDEIVICYEKEDFLCEPINFDDVGLICNPEPGITTLSVYQYINKHRYYGHLKPYFSNWGRPYGGK